MIDDTKTCYGCFSQDICSMFALSFESSLKRTQVFDRFNEVKQKAGEKVRDYFRLLTECVTLEQAAERERLPLSLHLEQN